MNDRQRFLTLVKRWGESTLDHGTPDQIAAFTLGLTLLIQLIQNPPACHVETEQAIERAVKLFFI